MPLPDWTRNRRRLALVAAVVVVAVLAIALLMRGPGEDAPPPGEAGPRPLEIDTPPLPIPPLPLSQDELVAVAARAAAAQALGEPAPAPDHELVGRRFHVRIPFGCEGPQASGSAYWQHDTARETITLRAHPEIWTATAWVRQLAGAAGIDAVEGFWLSRLDSEDCPPAGADDTAAETLGLAMFFEPNSSRLLRRGSRPYEYVGKAPEDGPVAPEGFRLLLAGRITGFEGGEPARCRKDGPPERPVCLIAVAFDQVAFEDPASGKTLAEWRMN